MPTGYTADVADGEITEIVPFVLQLARGMGALIMMRDEPWDAPIPETFSPSDYNEKKLAEVRAERDRLYGMTVAEAQAESDRAAEEYQTAYEQAAADHAARRERYLAMIVKVEAWTGAPEGIKEFGLEQLRSGLDFDCGQPFKYYREQPPSDGEAWRAQRLEKVSRDFSYHMEEHAKELARTEGRNEWLAQLRRSLAGEA